MVMVMLDDAVGDAADEEKDNKLETDNKVDSRVILDRIRIHSTECHQHYHPYHRCSERKIPHIRQDETWDCGAYNNVTSTALISTNNEKNLTIKINDSLHTFFFLLSGLTCVQMILQWLRLEDDDELDVINDSTDDAENDSIIQTHANIEKAWLIEFVATKSIWTIDLVMVLQYLLSSTLRNSNNNTNVDGTQETDRRECSLDWQLHLPHNFSYLFCSTNFGVETSYSSLEYYHDAYPSDEIRIRNHFRAANEQNLPLLRTSHLRLQVLVEVISHRDVAAIVLIDNAILRNLTTGESYSGHYVILCGVSYDADDIQYAKLNYPDENDNTPQDGFCIAINNPGNWKHIEYVTTSIFEKAWRAKGTDEDVIFIAKHAREIECIKQR
jgi:hypothetical protein